MCVSGQEKNLGVDWVPVLGRLDPTSNLHAGMRILLLGLELSDFSRKSRSLLWSLSQVILVGTHWAGAWQKDAERLQTVSKGHK